jgi:hypothetical protein
MKQISRLTIALGLSVLAVTACGSSSSKQTSDGTATTAAAGSGAVSAAGQQYLDIVGPANDAIRAQVTKIQALPNSATAAELKAITDPWADAIEKTCDELGKVKWPDKAAADMKKLIAAWTVAAKQVRSGPTIDPSGWQAWASTVSDASVAASQIAATVRADLGLSSTDPVPTTAN